MPGLIAKMKTKYHHLQLILVHQQYRQPRRHHLSNIPLLDQGQDIVVEVIAWTADTDLAPKLEDHTPHIFAAVALWKEDSKDMP